MDTEALLSSLLQSDGDQDVDVQELLGAVQRLQSGLETLQGAILPTPGFVIKTSDESGRKFFLNMCTSEVVAPPENWTPGSIPEAVQRFLEPDSDPSRYFSSKLEAEKLLRIPLYPSKPRIDIDHKGEECTVMDCVVAPEVLKRAGEFRPLKMFLCQLAMHVAEQQCKTQLNPQHKLPKMKSKGTPAAMDISTEAEQRKQKQQPAALISKDNGSTASIQETTKTTTAAAATAKKEGPTTINHSMRFIGKPVERVEVTLDLPESAARIARTSPAEIQLELCSEGEAIHVAIQGCMPLVIQLPFAVHGMNGGGIADVLDNGRKLVLKLPYRPLADIWRENMKSV